MNEEKEIVQMPVEPCCTEAVHIGVQGNDWYRQSQKDDRFNIAKAKKDHANQQDSLINRFVESM